MDVQKLVPFRPLTFLGKSWRAGEGGGQGVEGRRRSRGGRRPWHHSGRRVQVAGKSLQILPQETKQQE